MGRPRGAESFLLGIVIVVVVAVEVLIFVSVVFVCGETQKHTGAFAIPGDCL